MLPDWKGRWIQSHWSPSQSNIDIIWKELFAIVAAVHTWGSLWSRQKKLFHCDIQAVVDIWDRGSTCCPHTMGLVRLLYFCASCYNINVCVTHIAGVCNDIADFLSHFQMDKFRFLAPRSEPLPDSIPPWPSQIFMTASCSAGILVLPNPHDAHTSQASRSSSHFAVNTPLQQASIILNTAIFLCL